jgi:hypothetical protein
MTTPAISEKLKNELSKGIKTEPQALYLLAEVRKLIERDQAKGQYPDLKFHCDWALHSKLEGRAAQKILIKFDAAHPLLRDQKLHLRDLSPFLRSEINRISRMRSFEEQMFQFLQDYGLPPLTRKGADGWAHFLHLYAGIVEDVPLIVRGTKAQHIAMVVLHLERAKKKIAGETLFAVTWSIHDKNGQSGTIRIFNSYQ